MVSPMMGAIILESSKISTILWIDVITFLIAFGALKVATRLHDEKESEISNNYFLTGNLISILIAMLDAIIAKELYHF